ncbi:MAG TPA: polysaccharide pyruvyl transferase family protein, partial [Acidimicrobiia bacterium]|nr:polysaccharide pyruvyl transferase family protein [Acidimicrobiia bacterium]
LSQQWDANLHWFTAAVRLPGLTRTKRPEGLIHRSARRQELAIEVITRKRSIPEAAAAYVRSRRPLHGRSEAVTPPAEGEGAIRPRARYVGWTGHHNLGDEVMVESIRSLLPWADVETTGDPGRLLILGGGTLINRSSYLKKVMGMDSPSVERCVVGTGVASPDYWGVIEDPETWVRWLSTCVYVGVRGPHSYDRLRSWGFDGELEVSGDSALLIEPPAVDKVPGRVVIAPVWTKGRLWGGSDEAVVKVLASAVKTWLDEGRDVVALSSSPDDDGQILQIGREAGETLLPFVQGYLDIDRAVETISSADLVVGERLHACVLAAAVGTAFVPIEYRPKLRDFAASVGVEDLVIRSDELNEGILAEHVDAAVATGTDVVADNVSRYRERLISAAKLIERAVEA